MFNHGVSVLASFPVDGAGKQYVVQPLQNLEGRSFDTCTSKVTTLKPLNHENILSEIEAWKSFESRLGKQELELYSIFAKKESPLLFCFFEKTDGDNLMLIGASCMTFHPKGDLPFLFLDAFLLHPSARGKGFGKRMFSTIKQIFLSSVVRPFFGRPLTHIFLAAYPSPEQYWTKMGFIPFADADKSDFEKDDLGFLSTIAIRYLSAPGKMLAYKF